ncbi:hypothetical protein [Acinetobacter sp. YH01020]|uniref:hypothetical protein n=1 Tax=Acinetobacter sp. YH01020 TaxID=2601034 RepID=UPI0015D185B8|nr:hypothetical protein [Acinetobacter sp. YH01020]
MDLRDQFAIAALQGLLANPQNWMVESEVLASAAYKHADAMIAEREKDDVETKDQIKKMLVNAIQKAHPGMQTSVFLPGRDLIFQLTTGMAF